MPSRSHETDSQSPALEAFLLGQVDFDRALALQQRLVEEVRNRDDGQITLLLCEHPTVITVGRGGSPGEIAMQSGPIRNRQIEVRWVNRGGQSLLHCPGQLAIYPLVPLQWLGFSVGEFLERLQAGIIETLDDLNVHGTTPPGRHGVWGRTGQLVALGVAVRHWVTYYGAYLNVCPPMGLFRLVEAEKGTVPVCAKYPKGGHRREALVGGKRGLSPFPPRMSCLVAERRGPVRMTAVRAALVRRLAECFGCDRYHLYTGHPLLRAIPAMKGN
jgi:lipoyl(octanoyl) transferase